MSDPARAPTGLGRRARRLSDNETERRMLEAAVAMVHRTGLTVSLDHINFEDVIRDADVARSAVYRRWPFKDLFFADLIKELAKEVLPPTMESSDYELIKRVVAGYLDRLESPEARRDLFCELFRQLSLQDFQALHASTEWRTYLALHATFTSLADGELRDQVRAVLAQSEQHRRALLAEAYQQIASLFGYSLRPELDATLDTMVTLADATMRGLVIMALPTPGIATYRTTAAPFGAAAAAEWSLPALGITGIVSAFLEPDPAITWDDERLAQTREALTELLGLQT